MKSISFWQDIRSEIGFDPIIFTSLAAKERGVPSELFLFLISLLFLDPFRWRGGWKLSVKRDHP
jgi:hypothetical protein